jgi:hypothetical protein
MHVVPSHLLSVGSSNDYYCKLHKNSVRLHLESVSKPVGEFS